MFFDATMRNTVIRLYYFRIYILSRISLLNFPLNEELPRIILNISLFLDFALAWVTLAAVNITLVLVQPSSVISRKLNKPRPKRNHHFLFLQISNRHLQPTNRQHNIVLVLCIINQGP